MQLKTRPIELFSKNQIANKLKYEETRSPKMTDTFLTCVTIRQYENCSNLDQKNLLQSFAIYDEKPENFRIFSWY